MEKKTIFSEEVEIPDIVEKRIADTLCQIQTEGKTMRKQKKIWKNKAAIAACVCVVAAGTVTAGAAVYYHWGRGTQGAIQADDTQQQNLTAQGVAEVYNAKEDYESLAVTESGVTVKPDTVITDGNMVYLSFQVEGYPIAENAEPGFESVDVYLDGEDENALNMDGGFYDGIVSNENAEPVYEDGSELAYTDDGNLISHYVDEGGNLEYVIRAFSSGTGDSLLGKKLHVDFTNMGTVEKADYAEGVAGNWNFTLTLPSQKASEEITLDSRIADSAFTVDSVELSPVSIEIHYSVNGEVETSGDENGVPAFCGVVLKDGTRLPYLGDGGMSSYTDESRTAAYVTSAFDRVIEPDEVQALLFRVTPGAEFVTVELP